MDPFDLLKHVEDSLRQHGFEEAAEVLKDAVLSASTGSELWGEVGQALVAIRKQWELPESIQADIDQLMHEVRKVWPSFRG